jgi:VWFA-related protein
MILSARNLLFLIFLSFFTSSLLAQSDAAPAPNAPAQAQTEAGTLIFHTSVRRVVVDVVVRDSNNQPVHGLTAKDFVVAEDGHPQNILSFDVYDLSTPSIAMPPNAPHPPANHFVNIPPIPERGPLYVILYDMVDIDKDDQIDARRQVMKFIKSMPDGTRFAVFIRSDGLYLVQGFTADKDLLYATLDPQTPKPHVPRVFMMGKNLGYNDPASMMNVLTQVTEFLEGVPGHKNLIWLAGVFPLALSPRKEDPREYEDQIINEVNVLTRAQVAVYPINVGGVAVNPAGALTGARPHGGNANSSTLPGGGPSSGPGAPTAPPAINTPDATGLLTAMQAQSSGDSVLTDYDVQKTLADSTGGHAFYSTNDVTAALNEATDIGGNYYSLSYSPSNAKDDGGRRTIVVRTIEKGYKLSYRRYYFTTALRPNAQLASAPAPNESGSTAPADPNDSLQPSMKHGAPMIHDLLFSAHIHADGSPVPATPEQMTKLADQPAYASTHHKDKPLAPVDLQKYVIDYRVTAKSQTQAGKSPTYEFAAAAYDTESRMLNGVMNNAAGETSPTPDPTKPGVFRVSQQLDVPVSAAWIRIGVRDKLTNRVGTLEVHLPLAPEPPTPPVTSAR